MNLTDHLEKLKYFHEVARLGTLKQASETVFISQPSLTKSIKILEEVIESPLFIRMPRGMKLTHEGELLYSYTQKLFASIADMEQKLSHPEDPMAGSLRIGTYDSIGIYFWPKFLKTFLNRYKKLEIELTTGRSSEMQTQLEAGKLDLVLIVDPKASENIEVKTLKHDTFKFYESNKTKKVYSSIDKAPIIAMPTASAGVQTIKDILTKLGIGNRKVYATSSLESVKELTINGLGIGLLPQMVAEVGLKNRKIKEVSLLKKHGKGIGEHTIGLAYPTYRSDSQIIKTLIEEIVDFNF